MERKIKEIKKILYDLRNYLKPEEDHCKTTRIGNAFSSNYIGNYIKVMKIKAKYYLLKTILM